MSCTPGGNGCILWRRAYRKSGLKQKEGGPHSGTKWRQFNAKWNPNLYLRSAIYKTPKSGEYKETGKVSVLDREPSSAPTALVGQRPTVFWNKSLKQPGVFSLLSDQTKQSWGDIWPRRQWSLAKFQTVNRHYYTPTTCTLVPRKMLVPSKRHPKPHLEFEKAPRGLSEFEKQDFFLICVKQNVTFWP